MKTHLSEAHLRVVAEPARVVAEFHRTFGYPVRERFPEDGLPEKEAKLRRNLCNEEAREVAVAVEGGDILQVAKEITDLEYVVVGTVLQAGLTPEEQAPAAIRWLLDTCSARMQSGLEHDDPVKSGMAAAAFLVLIQGLAAMYRLPLEALRSEVHRSNMDKTGPDGKPVYRASDNKLMKPEGYVPADVGPVLHAHGFRFGHLVAAE